MEWASPVSGTNGRRIWGYNPKICTMCMPDWTVVVYPDFSPMWPCYPYWLLYIIVATICNLSIPCNFVVIRSMIQSLFHCIVLSQLTVLVCIWTQSVLCEVTATILQPLHPIFFSSKPSPLKLPANKQEAALPPIALTVCKVEVGSNISSNVFWMCNINCTTSSIEGNCSFLLQNRSQIPSVPAAQQQSL